MYTLVLRKNHIYISAFFSSSRTLTELLKQPGEAGVVDGTGAHHPIGMGTNGISARALRSNNGQSSMNPPYICAGKCHDHDGGLALVEDVCENKTQFKQGGWGSKRRNINLDFHFHMPGNLQQKLFWAEHWRS